MQGQVKWFLKEKGYGFVQGDDGDDLFVHCSATQGEGCNALAEYRREELEIAACAPGLQASKVVKP